MLRSAKACPSVTGQQDFVMQFATVAALVLSALTGSASSWSKPESMAGFEGLREEAQHLVDTERSRKRRHHFCAVVERRKLAPGQRTDRPVQGWLYWPEGHWLYNIGPTDFPPLRDADIWDGGSIDLIDGVVRNERDRKGGYDRRVSWTVVQHIIDACRANGSNFVVEKRRAG